MAEAFAGLTRFRRIVDDIVVYDSDITQHDTHVRKFFQICPEKQLCRTSILEINFVRPGHLCWIFTVYGRLLSYIDDKYHLQFPHPS